MVYKPIDRYKEVARKIMKVVKAHNLGIGDCEYIFFWLYKNSKYLVEKKRLKDTGVALTELEVTQKATVKISKIVKKHSKLLKQKSNKELKELYKFIGEIFTLKYGRGFVEYSFDRLLRDIGGK